LGHTYPLALGIDAFIGLVYAKNLKVIASFPFVYQRLRENSLWRILHKGLAVNSLRQCEKINSLFSCVD
tara:strand:- start:697 stop:903 length:207 start_codon:yes stop_codon:yes gene_type:complete